jgi:hypothetical protein
MKITHFDLQLILPISHKLSIMEYSIVSIESFLFLDSRIYDSIVIKPKMGSLSRFRGLIHLDLGFKISFDLSDILPVIGGNLFGLFMLLDSAKRAALDPLKNLRKRLGKLKMDRSVHLGTDLKGYI